MSRIKLDWGKWLYGLASGFIGGGATSLTSSGFLAAAHASGMDVPVLNFKAMGLVWLGGGIWTAVAYLRQSPLPPEEPEVVVTTNIKV